MAGFKYQFNRTSKKNTLEKEIVKMKKSVSDKRIWSFVYEPTEFDEMILNKEVRVKLNKALDENPNLMLFGRAGVGKGTYAHIYLKHTGYDYLWVNASDETGIDTMRDKVKSFATSLGVTPLKIVVLNEADSLSQGAQGAQKMLKQLIEDVQGITRFIFLTNRIEVMMEELQSRCQVIEINNPPAKEIFLFASKILKSEKIKFEKKTLLSIIKKCYPDIRKTVWAIQENSINGKLIGDTIHASEALWKDILDRILARDAEHVRNLLRSNYVDYVALYEYLYNNAGEFNEPGGAILLIGDHLISDSNVAIKEINFMHMIIQMILQKVV
jgi:DNA polymerase III delta prime subunit